MNQTGVTSTGSRRQAFRNRLKALGTRLRGSPPAPLFADRDFEQLARERDQLLEPERLVSQFRAQLPNLVRLRIVEIVTPVAIVTGVLVSPGMARMARRNCRPLVSGMRRSRITACGRCVCARLSPSSADRAAHTS